MNLYSEQLYGVGVIKQMMAPGKNSMLPLPKERGVDKIPIHTNPNIKVDPQKGVNYFQNFLNESVSKQNYDEAEDLQVEQGIEFLEAMPNINLDFDGDGIPDFQQGGGLLQGQAPEKAKEAEVAEVIENKPMVAKEVEKPIVESTVNLEQAEHNKNPQPNRDDQLKTTDVSKGFNIKPGEGVVLASGALAMALMLFGRSAK